MDSVNAGSPRRPRSAGRVAQAVSGVGFQGGAVAAFFARVPGLYEAAARRQDHAYQELLYTIEHPLDRASLERITDAYGMRRPTWTDQAAADAIGLLDPIHYPDVGPLGRLRAVPGLTLSALSRILHHIHQAYPIYDDAACAGLARLGLAMPYVKLREPAVYGLYVSAIEELKQRIAYWNVPETNVVLGRIIQAALSEYGAEPH